MKTKKDKHLVVRVTAEELSKLKQVAEVHDTTMSNLVRSTLLATINLH